MTSLLDAEALQTIGHLELLSRTVVDGLLSGKHRSTTKGGCSEFAQHRQYAPGDEIRQIDWQVYARNDRYFIKQFEEETNLHAMVAVDTSGSMSFGMSTDRKIDYAKKTAACLTRLLLRQRDAVGLMMLDEAHPSFVPPRQNAAHLRAILSVLQSATAEGGGDLGVMIRHGITRLQRRGLFVLLSDCFDHEDELATALKIVRARGHDVIVMHVLAPEEITFDFRRFSAFADLEIAGRRLHLDPPAVRAEYLRQIGDFLRRIEAMVIGLGGDYVRLVTDRDIGDTLAWFLRNRNAAISDRGGSGGGLGGGTR
ncbi:MAG: DUF58 domain-containing protein [Planctomycetota bacterium]